MIRTQIYLPDDIFQELQLLAKTTNLNISQLIREGAKKVISTRASQVEGEREDWKQFAGSLKNGPKDMSAKINDIYK